MIAKPAEARGYAGPTLGLVALAILGLLACDGTKEAIFAPLKVSVEGPPGPVAGDSGAKPPVDAGGTHPLKPPKHPDSPEDDAGEPPDPGLDSTVTFVWTETLPGQGTCHAGVYAGSFDCEVPDPLGALPFSLSGQIAFTLDGSPEEPQLSITEGSMSSGLWLSSGLTGGLDCMSYAFVGASVDGQTVGIGDMNNPFALVFPTFDASLTGHYDTDMLVITGDFAMVNDRGDTCNGTFRVSSAP